MFNRIKKMFKKESEKYFVQFCVKEASSYNFIETRAINPTQKKISYKKGDKNEYIIDIENHTYRKGNNRFYCIDLNAEQIYFENLSEKDFTSSRVNFMVLEDSIIEQLARATTRPLKEKYDLKALITGLAIGGLVGLIIGIFIPFGV